MPNFHKVDWEEFSKFLEGRLTNIQPEEQITKQNQLDTWCTELTAAIQATINELVPTSDITPKSKHWWTKELTLLHKKDNKLGRQLYQRKLEPEHAIHEEHKVAAKRYGNTLEHTKKQHWLNWLEKAEDPNIWTAHQLISSAASDRGRQES
jgi:hypothetical protein